MEGSVPRQSPILVLVLVLAAFILTPAWLAGGVEPVEHYGDGVEVELVAEEEAALESVAAFIKGYGGDPLQLDPRLVLACRELAREIQGDFSRRSQSLSSNHEDDTLLKLGIYETATFCQPIAYGTVADIQSQVRLRFASESGLYTHMGAGVIRPDRQGRPGVAVIILSDKRADLSPFPRKVTLPSSWTLRGRLVHSSRGLKPHVLLTPPGGQVQTLPAGASGDSFSVSVPFNQGPGLYRLEVVAAGGGKSRNSAQLVVKAGMPMRTNSATFEVSGFDTDPGDEAEAEYMMVKMINQVRMKEGLKPLVMDSRLEEMARAHSRDMKENQYGIEHLSPRFGSIARRAEAAGLGEYEVKENLALNTSLVRAMNNLLQSPVHRAPVIDPQLTHVGVGIVFGERGGVKHYYITQEFAKMY